MPKPQTEQAINIIRGKNLVGKAVQQDVSALLEHIDSLETFLDEQFRAEWRRCLGLEQRQRGGTPITRRFNETCCADVNNCGWPECDCPRRAAIHSPEAIAYAFNKARELLVAAGLEETAALLTECKPR